MGFEFIFGSNWIPFYKWIYVFVIIVGAVVKLELIWNVADIANGLMALPNLVALLALSGMLSKLNQAYFEKLNRQRGIT